MILLLDTSTPVCNLTFTDENWKHEVSWEAGRGLAKGLLSFLETQLHEVGKGWDDITGIVSYQGPGSFTGLRIGITVCNSLAYAGALPIVGTVGENWQELGIQRLHAGENDEIVMPEYGGEANITQPRK